MDRPSFPSTFVWGVSSSSCQIEGASSPEHRGESVWDAFARRSGTIHSGHTPAIACDHFNRYMEDIAIMRRMGAQAYRLSIAWPRVLPEGIGQVNDAGLDWYDRVVDALLAASIEPWITLFHWDFPLDLFRQGGWLHRDSARWMADFAAIVTHRLSDRVTHWMTINEPQVFLQLGHADGTHAPGLKLPMSEVLLAAHNTLRAHGLAASAIRAHAHKKPSIGWAPVGHVQFPTENDVASIEAARRATFSITKTDLWNNTWFADPVFFGQYPEDGLRLYATDVPRFPDADMKDIQQPMDFYGVNIYSGTPLITTAAGPAPRPGATGAPRTAFNWTIEPQALHWGPRFLHDRYKVPVYITENGMSSLDWVDVDGCVLDTGRIDYTRRYLLALAQAVEHGTDVRGYFHWSILDNFEWAEGYKERFGLVHVDFETLQRTPKLSASWYAQVIASQGKSLHHPVSLDITLPPLDSVRHSKPESPVRSH
jgi:beta-glucosidase